MSEESNQSAPVEETGNPTFADDGAVTLEGVTFPPVEASAEPAAALEATPEPVAAEPAMEPPADPFAPIKLENGDYELKLETGERFVGKTEGELLRNIAQSKLEANKYIQTLKAQPPASPAPVQEPQQQQMDPATLALVDMIAPAFGVKTGQELIDRFQQMQQSQSTVTEMTQTARDNQTAAEFFQTNKDFVATQANIERLGEALDGMGLPFTAKNAQFAHYALKGRGAYEAAPITPPAAARAENGQFVPKANPLPPSGPAPVTTGKGAPTEQDMWNMPVAELEALMQAQMAG